MKTKYKVVFKMAGGTILKVKEFVKPAGVIYCATQDVLDDANEVQIEDLETGGIVSYELSKGVGAKRHSGYARRK